MKDRSLRLASLIQEELSKLILKDVDIAPGILVTVTSMNISANSEYADIGISVYPEAARKDTLKDMQKAAGGLHYKLIRILNIRTVPRLQFFLDHGSENAAAIEKVMIKNPGEFLVVPTVDLPEGERRDIEKQ